MTDFLNFTTLGPYNLKMSSHTINMYKLCSNHKKVGKNALEPKKHYNFLLHVTKFCPLAKNCWDPKFIPQYIIFKF